MKTKLIFILRFTVFLFLPGFMMPSMGWATTYYVDPNGVDTAARDGSQSEPWATLSYACSRVPSGEHGIHINPGIYTDSAQCVLGIGVDIEGAGKDRVMVNSDYSGAYIQAHSDSITAGNHEISGFTITGGADPDNRALDLGIWIRNRTTISIHDMEFRNIECPVGTTQAGAIEIENDTMRDICTEPSSWITGIAVYDCDFFDSARHKEGNNASGAIHAYGVSGLEIYNCTFDESNTDGHCIKSVDGGGWLRNCSIHDNSFTVSSIPRKEQLLIELWGVSEDTEVYGNVFENGYISIINGKKLNTSWALRFHNNELLNCLLHEFSISNVDIYNNLFRGYFSSGVFGGGGIGLWATHCYVDRSISNFRVRNNVFQDLLDYAVYLIEHTEGEDTSYDQVHIYNNVIDTVTEDGHGIYISLNRPRSIYTDFEIKNNIIINCDGYGVRAGGSAADRIIGLELTHNLFDDNQIDYDVGGTTNPTVSNNLTESPDINGSGDSPRPYYEPTGPGANVVDAGIDVGLPYGTSAPDIGAFEYPSADWTISTSNGRIFLTTGAGRITDASLTDESSFSTAGKPYVRFLYGLIGFRISGVPLGGVTDIELLFPDNIPTNLEYWKHGATVQTPNGEWYEMDVGSNDRDNTLTISLTDGDLGDDDLQANGVIVDPGGPAVPLAAGGGGGGGGGCFVSTTAQSDI